MTSARLTFRPDGSAVCLHTDLLPLADLGTLTVERNSEVEFNHGTQLWEVRRPGRAEVLFTHASRSVCIEWEVTHLAP